MPAKNSTYYKDLSRAANRPVISIQIDRLINSDRTHIKAIATVNLGGAFVVHDVKVVDGQKGLFVQTPQSSYTKDGKTVYQDLFHAVTAQSRKELISGVMAAYEYKIQEVYGQDATQQPKRDYFQLLEDDDPDLPFDPEEGGPGDSPGYDMQM